MRLNDHRHSRLKLAECSTPGRHAFVANTSHSCVFNDAILQDDRVHKLVSAGEVAQLFRTPGLSESAAAALKNQAQDAGIMSISDISMEVVSCLLLLMSCCMNGGTNTAVWGAW